MKKRFARLPSPAMTVAFVALLAALTGTAVALPGRNTVDSGDIRNNQVRTQDIRNGHVRSSDVRNNTLTGADVNEGRLGTVPSANQAGSANVANFAGAANSAGNANTVGGNAVSRINYLANDTAAETVIYNAGGLLLRAGCAGGVLGLEFQSTVAGGWLTFTGVDNDPNTTDGNAYFDRDPGDPPDDIAADLPDNDGTTAQLHYSTPGGRVVSVFLDLQQTYRGFDCSITGHAIRG